jgi:hypothetical protein
LVLVVSTAFARSNVIGSSSVGHYGGDTAPGAKVGWALRVTLIFGALVVFGADGGGRKAGVHISVGYFG